MNTRLVTTRATAIAAATVLVLVPVLFETRTVSLTSRYLLFGIAALGLDLLWGKAGLLSFGHAAMFGLGCYASGLVLTNTSGSAAGLLAVGVGVAVPAALGLVMGFVLFKGRVLGVYFGIVTLLAGLILEQLAGTWGGLTGGFNGLLVPLGLHLGPLHLDDADGIYFAVLAVAAAAYLATRWFSRTPFGMAVEASRMNDTRAESLGYDVAWLRAVTLAIAGGLGGLGGALYAPVEGFVYPAQVGLMESTAFIVWVAIGGRGTLIGAFVGAILVNMAESRLSSSLQEYWPLATGCGLLAIILFQPAGLVGTTRRTVRST